MTTTINASTTAGLVQTADTSGLLALQTAGTTALTVDTSQNVGVGTTSPAYKLDVQNAGGLSVRVNNTSSTSPAQFRSTNTLTTVNFGVDSTGGYVETQGAYPTLFYTNSTERMRVNAGAPILCLAGGNTSATGTGIAFPATQSASTDANTLDDYEEGSCTLVISDSSGNNATMGGGNVFRYIKIGRMVSVSGTLSWDSVTGVTTSRTRITGLPFAASSVNAMRWPAVNGSSSINSFNITRSEIAFGLDFNNAFLWGTKVTGNNLDNNLDINSFGTSGTMYGLQVTYFTEN